MSFNQGAPTVNTILNTSNCLVFGNTASGNALSVRQFGAGNCLSVSNANGTVGLFVSSTSNVGIGTNNPSYKLDVRGTSIFGDQFGVGGTTGNQSNVISYFGNSSSGLFGALKIIGTRTATGTDWTTTSLRIQKFVDSTQMGYMEFGAPGGNTDIAFGSAGGTERMRITGTGNVGIGTTNPGYALDIGNFAVATPQVLRLQAASVTSGTMGTSIRLMEANDTYGFSLQNLQQRFGFFRHSASYNGSEIISISRDNPFVGIGSTNPGALLTCGAAYTNGGAHAEETGSKIILGCNNQSGPYGVGIQMRVPANSTVNESDMQFTTSDNSGNQLVRMTIKGTSNPVGGNVGIGTASPAVALDVYTGTANAATVVATNHYGKIAGANTASFSNVLCASGLPASIIQGSNVFVFSNSSGVSNVMVMNSLGQVGIGTSNPSCLLDFNTSASINKVISLWQQSAAAPATATDFTGFGVSTNILRYQSSTNSAGGHRWYMGADEAMRIGVSGGILKVGVGTNNLQNRFGVAGNVGIGTTYVDTAAPTDGLIVQGSVGIGSTNPVFKLDVYGTTTSNTYTAAQAIGNSGGTLFHMCNSGVAYAGHVFGFGVSPTLKFYIDLGGIGPHTDGGITCGNTVRRFTSVAAINGTIQTSDSRFKNSSPLPYGLKEILQANTIIYSWKTQASLPDDNPEKNFKYFGVCADQLMDILPELCYNENPDAPIQLNYSEIVPVCINAIKELSAENTLLKTQLASIEARLAAAGL